ncbi:MAG TPA: c-type cytochrome [Ferruginibacter sp.]|jgi:mono/diheme cytochrome c family protein|nr:c-type cytochrome [Ferruginibacter sp.]
MKKALKIIGILVCIIILGVAAIASYVKVALPNVGAITAIKVNSTPENIQRGEYLANHVLACMDCHSTRDEHEFAAPLVAGTLGKGGEKFDQTMGFPGVYYAANITPAGIGAWSDGEIFRAITTGVGRDGHAMFPVMPYASYGKLDQNDIEDVIAYLRTLPAIENTVTPPHSDFPMSIIINTIPKKASLTTIPSSNDSLAYGKYLFTAAACHDCHTPFVSGKYDETKFMSGGREFQVANGTVTSANLTPDETGIGNWNREAFINKFRTYRDSTEAHQKLQPSDMQTIMPWTAYAGMTDKDLSAIYTYLQTIPAINNSVVKFKPKN